MGGCRLAVSVGLSVQPLLMAGLCMSPLITPAPSWRMYTDTVEYIPVIVHSISGEVYKCVLKFSVNWKEEFKFRLT